MIGYDYTDPIAPAALKAAGCAVAFRYVMPQTPYWTKALRNPEAQQLLGAGIPIVSNFESSANRELAGASGGRADAETLLADWKALGAPSGLIGWFSADWDVQPDEVPTMLAYLDGAAAVLGGKKYVGCYGGLRAVKAAADAGYGIWQTVAWSGGVWDPRAVARQTGKQLTVGGVQVDENVILSLAGLGAWGATAAPTPTGGSTVGTIPPSIAQKYPELAADFPPNGSFADETALIWADARAALAADRAQKAIDAVNALAAKVGEPAPAPTVDVNALAAAITAAVVKAVEPAIAQAIPPAQADVEAAIAGEVVAHLGIQVVAK